MIKPLLSAAALAAIAFPALAQTPPPSAAPAKPPPACQEPERRQFDFWVGEWDVYPTGKDNLVAHSRIESLYGGCAVRENWMPLKGTGGGSLSAFVPADKGWRQTWTDSSGGWVEFTGGWTGEALVLEGSWPGAVTPGQPALVRMTYTKGADGSVRQFGEGSTDDGKTWAPNFDFTYRPAKAG
ncbi:MAG: hypothetical protein KF842_08190 [Caulobacter sp.]|nr:hypothetical protein [Caulobacter sp.]